MSKFITELKPRRIARIGVAADFLANLVQGTQAGHSLIFHESVPSDAKFMNAWHDRETGVIWLVFEYSTFDEVPVGASCPVLDAAEVTTLVDERANG